MKNNNDCWKAHVSVLQVNSVSTLTQEVVQYLVPKQREKSLSRIWRRELGTLIME